LRGSVVAEAREALLAVHAGEQVFYQRFVTYTNAADTAEIRTKLGVHLDGPSARWRFSVSKATVTGYVAEARGREDTRAEAVVVTLTHERGEVLAWTVERRGRGRIRDDPP
jgi:hypothetical protein